MKFHNIQELARNVARRYMAGESSTAEFVRQVQGFKRPEHAALFAIEAASWLSDGSEHAFRQALQSLAE